jgi:hypothetical protein
MFTELSSTNRTIDRGLMSSGVVSGDVVVFDSSRVVVSALVGISS